MILQNSLDIPVKKYYPYHEWRTSLVGCKLVHLTLTRYATFFHTPSRTGIDHIPFLSGTGIIQVASLLNLSYAIS